MAAFGRALFASRELSAEDVKRIEWKESAMWSDDPV